MARVIIKAARRREWIVKMGVCFLPSASLPLSARAEHGGGRCTKDETNRKE